MHTSVCCPVINTAILVIFLLVISRDTFLQQLQNVILAQLYNFRKKTHSLSTAFSSEGYILGAELPAQKSGQVTLMFAQAS